MIIKVPELLQRRGLSRPLIVTGPRVSKMDFFQRLEQALTEAEIQTMRLMRTERSRSFPIR